MDEIEDKTEETKVDEKEPAFSIDEVAGVDLDVTLHDLKEEASEGDKEETGDKAEEKKEEAKPSEPTAKERELEERATRLERDKNDLKKALHEARQERKKAKEEPQVILTDAELMKIVQEHKDDPTVLLNAAKYIAQQEIKKGKGEVLNQVETDKRRGELNGILKERIKDYDNEDSEPHALINRAKVDFALDDHPYSDFLATAAAVYMDLPNIAKSWIEEGKKQALNDKADNNRKDSIKKTQLTPGGSKLPSSNVKNMGLTESQLETAKRMGLTTPEKLKIYKSQILKSSNANA